jgi:predicted Ser/Thr protein kinase
MATRPLVGTVFAGYRVERVLGRGGMSVVYLAEHPRLKNMVALKLLAPALAEDDLFRERLVRESQLAASLNHPNVIPVFDTGEEDGVLFISMRFVDGVDLRSMLRDALPSIERTAEIVSQAASALDAAHARGLVHRDVKPANILIETGGEPPGHVYVADFGLTKHTDARTGATASGVVGTVDYMAPEQIEGRQLDARADVYALGCVLYECLTGKPPFEHANDVAVLWAHIREEPPLPSSADRSLPRAFDAIVDRALAKDPRDRYESAGALAADVREAAHTRKKAARLPRPRLPRARRRRGHRRWLFPTIAGLLIGAAAGAAIAVAVRDDNGPAPSRAAGRVAAAPDATLLGFVPAQLKSSCARASAPTPDFDTSITCTPDDPNVTSVRYSHAETGRRMHDHFLARAWAEQAALPGVQVQPAGSCPNEGSTAVRDWTELPGARRTQMFLSTPGAARGRLLCYTSAFGWSGLEWTDTTHDVYSVAYGRTRYALYRWWRVRGGLN